MRVVAGASAITCEPLGECALLIRFGSCIALQTSQRVHEAAAALRAAALPGVTDIVPAFATLALIYAPACWSGGGESAWRQLADAVLARLQAPHASTRQTAALIEIPVCYGGEYGPDLALVAQHCGLSTGEIVKRHTSADYCVAMLGFAPGFPYLLGLDPMLETPRRANPRTHVAGGSVAIGGAQTGIYPSDLPGGWQVIGRTPIELFDPQRDRACLLAPGDRVRFRAIGAREFHSAHL